MNGAKMRGAVAVVMAVVLCAAAPAAAKKRRKQTIAVLEYRAGATGLPDVGGRMALLLRSDTGHEILDPDDARRIGSNKIDEAVAKCAGEAPCIAELGRKLSADEVLLVGVSEFGDLILAIQRVDAKSGKVMARVADSLAADAEPDDAQLEGYLKRLLPPEDFLRYGTIRVAANVKGARVTVNGEARGETPIAPLTVPAPSTVDLRVSKSGYADFTARLDVVPEGTVEVSPVLVKHTSAWYQHWWVWAIGGTLVAGGVTAAVILAQPEPSSVPVFVDF